MDKNGHAVPRTRTWYGGPRQKIGSSADMVLARVLRISFASLISAAAASVYSPGTRKYKQKECLIS